MELNQIFSKLWDIYTIQNPSVQKVYDIFTKEGEEVLNDHIAFRTFDDPRVNIAVLSKIFLDNGYEYIQSYEFKEKKLFAKHFEHKTDKTMPRIFISELLTSNFSPFLKEKVKEILNQIDYTKYNSDNMIFAGRIWDLPSYETYQKLIEESEYAGWLYYNGFCANHFTVSINSLKKLDSLQKVNSFLEENGFRINTSGGAIKGTPEELLEQSSIMADKHFGEFTEGKFEITGCYYEFAKRYADENGELYSGFIAKSADKIFESTDFKK